jgi:hypothetical protein
MTILQFYALVCPLIGSAFVGSVALILFRRDMTARASLVKTISADGDNAGARAAFEEFLQSSPASADVGDVARQEIEQGRSTPAPPVVSGTR